MTTEASKSALTTALETLREERWYLLQRAMLLSDVASVAAELGELAVRYSEARLGDYASELSAAVEQINQPRIEDLLKRFDELIKNLS